MEPKQKKKSKENGFSTLTIKTLPNTTVKHPVLVRTEISQKKLNSITYYHAPQTASYFVPVTVATINLFHLNRRIARIRMGSEAGKRTHEPG